MATTSYGIFSLPLKPSSYLSREPWPSVHQGSQKAATKLDINGWDEEIATVILYLEPKLKVRDFLIGEVDIFFMSAPAVSRMALAFQSCPSTCNASASAWVQVEVFASVAIVGRRKLVTIERLREEQHFMISNLSGDMTHSHLNLALMAPGECWVWPGHKLRHGIPVSTNLSALVLSIFYNINLTTMFEVEIAIRHHARRENSSSPALGATGHDRYRTAWGASSISAVASSSSGSQKLCWNSRKQTLTQVFTRGKSAVAEGNFRKITFPVMHKRNKEMPQREQKHGMYMPLTPEQEQRLHSHISSYWPADLIKTWRSAAKEATTFRSSPTPSQGASIFHYGDLRFSSVTDTLRDWEIARQIVKGNMHLTTQGSVRLPIFFMLVCNVVDPPSESPGQQGKMLGNGSRHTNRANGQQWYLSVVYTGALPGAFESLKLFIFLAAAPLPKKEARKYDTPAFAVASRVSGTDWAASIAGGWAVVRSHLARTHETDPTTDHMTVKWTFVPSSSAFASRSEGISLSSDTALGSALRARVYQIPARCSECITMHLVYGLRAVESLPARQESVSQALLILVLTGLQDLPSDYWEWHACAGNGAGAAAFGGTIALQMVCSTDPSDNGPQSPCVQGGSYLDPVKNASIIICVAFMSCLSFRNYTDGREAHPEAKFCSGTAAPTTMLRIAQGSDFTKSQWQCCSFVLIMIILFHLRITHSGSGSRDELVSSLFQGRCGAREFFVKFRISCDSRLDLDRAVVYHVICKALESLEIAFVASCAIEITREFQVGSRTTAKKTQQPPVSEFHNVFHLQSHPSCNNITTNTAPNGSHRVRRLPIAYPDLPESVQQDHRIAVLDTGSPPDRPATCPSESIASALLPRHLSALTSLSPPLLEPPALRREPVVCLSLPDKARYGLLTLALIEVVIDRVNFGVTRYQLQFQVACGLMGHARSLGLCAILTNLRRWTTDNGTEKKPGVKSFARSDTYIHVESTFRETRLSFPRA
ncbi:uncharacterized protein MYCFIDRAFT_180078 [Pseudocercospora fijiensis CIRAD86]|uniref:Uncharacterized protein n=1 Tax=Pseudocercospora fijiensis (strain CIRAD86) TaxID=383855 RepID=M2ZYK9_PSEFD|nr:uncharacterized protein MYCFIDRAFT_180078 [Pseudocercospora fijiensis CIRAD86]EME77201.1 hypothetical protein MYCFIDRAFT_180078 [Pseudocercospora fijiensis CIRAD86]